MCAKGWVVITRWQMRFRVAEEPVVGFVVGCLFHQGLGRPLSFRAFRPSHSSWTLTQHWMTARPNRTPKNTITSAMIGTGLNSARTPKARHASEAGAVSI